MTDADQPKSGRGRRLVAVAVAVLVTAAVLAILLRDIDFAELKEVFGRAELIYFVAALALVPLTQWVRAWRFSLLLFGTPSPPRAGLYRISAHLVLFNLLLPYRTGELSFPIMVRRAYGIGFPRSAGVLAFARLADLLAILAYGCASVALVLGDRVGPGFTALLACGAAGSLLAIFALPWSASLVERALGPGGPEAGGRAFVRDLLGGVTILRTNSRRLLALSLTLAIWVIQIAVALLAIRALSAAVTVAAAAFASAAASLSFALPINGVGGVGPMQLAWAWALELFGMQREVALATAFTWHAVLVIGAGLLSLAVLVLCPRDEATRAA